MNNNKTSISSYNSSSQTTQQKSHGFRVAQNIILIISDIIDILKNNDEDIIIERLEDTRKKIDISLNLDQELIIENFIKYYKIEISDEEIFLWDKIFDKDIGCCVKVIIEIINSYRDNNDKLKDISDLKIQKIKNLIVKTEKQIEDLWKYLRNIVKICIKYILSKRKKFSDNKESKNKNIWYIQEDIFSFVDIQKEIKKWEIDPNGNIS